MRAVVVMLILFAAGCGSSVPQQPAHAGRSPGKLPPEVADDPGAAAKYYQSQKPRR